MKKLLFPLFFLVGCATPPNKPVCVTDAPAHAHCAWMIKGDDFEADNSGAHQYAQDGRNWNYDELIKYSLIMPPDSYKAIKEFILNYCHQNQNSCPSDQIEKALKKIELQMNFNK